jgi:hypothetical protein
MLTMVVVLQYELPTHADCMNYAGKWRTDRIIREETIGWHFPAVKKPDPSLVASGVRMCGAQ